MGHLPFIVKSFHPLEIGSRGEKIAVDFLKKKGLQILAKNYRFKKKEIDIIAKDKDTICFIEVKTRTTKEFGLPEEAIMNRKMRNLINLALSYMKRYNFVDYNIRFDVVSIYFLKNNKPKIDYFKNAFISKDFYGI